MQQPQDVRLVGVWLHEVDYPLCNKYYMCVYSMLTLLPHILWKSFCRVGEKKTRAKIARTTDNIATIERVYWMGILVRNCREVGGEQAQTTTHTHSHRNCKRRDVFVSFVDAKRHACNDDDDARRQFEFVGVAGLD